MTLLETSKIFFEALDFPPFARPNFYIKKQKESGWAKGVYLTALSEVYHRSLMVLQMRWNSLRSKQPDLDMDDVSIEIRDVDKGEDATIIKKEQLDSLHLAILASYSFDKANSEYSAVEILSFVEYALWFIRQEFKIQAKEIESLNFRPRTETYFNYYLSQDAPFFNFPKFKHAIRELLLNSRNPDNLKVILSKFENAAKEIVKLWNEKVFNLHNIQIEGESKNSEIVHVEFRAEELKHIWWVDIESFKIIPHKYYSNQDFASYAANIANILAEEILGLKENIVASEKDFVKDFILGIEELHDKGVLAPCIKNIKEGKNYEEPFRDWFSTWFQARDYFPNSESKKSEGYIDLKILHASIGKKVIEFKGWWNDDRKKIVEQVCRYINDVDGDGYIFMINHTSDNIDNEYKEMITDVLTGYLDESWIENSFKKFQYFRTEHKYGATRKLIYHFIFNVPIYSGRVKVKSRRSSS